MGWRFSPSAFREENLPLGFSDLCIKVRAAQRFLVSETNLQLPEEVEHGHAHHNDHKGSQRRDHVHGRHAAPLLEEDDGGGQNHGGEEDVVDGVDQQGVEGVQRLVQVIHL